MEKLQTFCQNKFETGGSGQDIVDAYEAKRGEARETVEAMNITKRVVSTGPSIARIPAKPDLTSSFTAKVLQQHRLAAGGDSPTGLSRARSTGGSSLGSASIGRSNTMASTTSGASKFSSLAAKKSAPPPPPSSNSALPPPPYSSSASGAASVASKRAPPPPPIKPKPGPPAKPVVYVTAVYDFEAQADGDLSFKAGDKIEIVERSDSAEDWWTGKLRGQQGVFPGTPVACSMVSSNTSTGNYVQL